MYRAVITDLGRTRLGTADGSARHQALVALVSPPLEAGQPRALFDAFCLRLAERWGVSPSSDEYRGLWRALRDEGWITVCGSLQEDAGRAFAYQVPLGKQARLHRNYVNTGDVPSSQSAAPSARQNVPLLRRPISAWCRTLLVRLQAAIDEE